MLYACLHHNFLIFPGTDALPFCPAGPSFPPLHPLPSPRHPPARRTRGAPRPCCCRGILRLLPAVGGPAAATCWEVAAATAAAASLGASSQGCHSASQPRYAAWHNVYHLTSLPPLVAWPPSPRCTPNYLNPDAPPRPTIPAQAPMSLCSAAPSLPLPSPLSSLLLSALGPWPLPLPLPASHMHTHAWLAGPPLAAPPAAARPPSHPPAPRTLPSLAGRLSSGGGLPSVPAPLLCVLCLRAHEHPSAALCRLEPPR